MPFKSQIEITCRTKEVKDLVIVRGKTVPSLQGQITSQGLTVAVETEIIIWPVGIIDLLIGSKYELLVDVSGVAGGECEGSVSANSPKILMTPVIETQTRLYALNL